jgi:K+-transporting ATPase A subunit
MLRWLEYAVFIAILLSLAKPIGLYIARVFERQPTFSTGCCARWSRCFIAFWAFSLKRK